MEAFPSLASGVWEYFYSYPTPNPDKPEPKLIAKTKTETNKIEFGTQELTKGKTIFS
jgi:hypothetical protein